MAILKAFGLGSGARLGTWGLRQGKDILSDFTDVPFIENPLQAFLISPGGTLINFLTAGRGDGERLKANNIAYTKYGGLVGFDVEIKRENKIPLFSDMGIRLAYKNEAVAFGYVSKVPETDQSGGIVTVSCSGFAERMKEYKVNELYQSQTVKQILDDLATDLQTINIVYNTDKASPPNLTIDDIEFTDISLYDVMMQLINICNNAFDTEEYIFGVDTAGHFYFTQIAQTTIQDTYFEGFQYQNPKTDTESSTISNALLLYRTGLTSGGVEREPQYVDTYTDETSIDLYGRREEKVMIPNYIDTTSMEGIADGLLAEFAYPKKRIEVEKLETDTLLNFGFYNISNKKQLQKNVISGFTALTDWTVSDDNSTLEISTLSFTQTKSFKWTLNNSLGDYIEKTFDRLYSPTELRLYARGDVRGETIKITLTGEAGYEEFDALFNDDDALLNDDDMVFFDHEDWDDEHNIDIRTLNDWNIYVIPLSGIFYLSGVKIEVIANTSTIIYLDRLEIFANMYYTNTLDLQEVTYRSDGKMFIADKASFGAKPIKLTDTLNDRLKAASKPADTIFKR